jgi:hypothetical protein
LKENKEQIHCFKDKESQILEVKISDIANYFTIWCNKIINIFCILIEVVNLIKSKVSLMQDLLMRRCIIEKRVREITRVSFISILGWEVRHLVQYLKGNINETEP